MMSQYQKVPQSVWKNQCPIILVHGLGGSTSEENIFLQGYWHYCFLSEVLTDSNGASSSHLIFEADVSPFGSVHDRACELYQQLVGIESIKRIAHRRKQQKLAETYQEKKEDSQIPDFLKISRNESDDDIIIQEIVYGSDHVHKEHRDFYYKPRYLKNIQNGKFLGYPNGIPGGWCKHRKIHFVAHSLGAQTVRYLQHLLEINYFEVECDCEHSMTTQSKEKNLDKETDRSDWIASVTCINPGFNGAIGTYFFGMEQQSQRFNPQKFASYFIPEVFKHYYMLQNLVSGSMNKSGEIIKKRYHKGSEKFYELGYQQTYVFFDLNSENLGFNKNKNENWNDYIKRVQESDAFYKTQDLAVIDLLPEKNVTLNSKLKVYEHTYYFAIGTSIHNKKTLKKREILTTPNHISQSSLGYDIDVDKRIKFNQPTKHQSIKRNTVWNRLGIAIKTLINPISLNQVLFTSGMTNYLPHYKSQNNAFNPNMNNVGAIDICNKDRTGAIDPILELFSQEFPRQSSKYQNTIYDQSKKPWGQKSEPIQFDCKEDASWLCYLGGSEKKVSEKKQYYEKGVWYYDQLNMIDHQDLVGLPPYFNKLRIFFGQEYRQQFYINTFNRIRSLEVKDQVPLLYLDSSLTNKIIRISPCQSE